MTPETLRTAKRKTIGAKQTMKGICLGRVANVFLAADAEPHVTEPILRITQEKDVPVIMVKTMAELGKACGIRIGAAAAGLLKEEELLNI